ncbi:MAG: stability/partitioning determinant [Gammaproteobacteria bacterium]
MTNGRASIFDEDADDLDLSGFEPKKGRGTVPGAPPEKVRAVAEANKFTSRSPGPPKRGAPARRIHRTGRNIQLNIKASQATVDLFYRIADDQGWVLGETLERALEVLDKSLRPNAEEAREQ